MQKRSANFTQDEIEVLVEEVSKQSAILFGKFSSTNTDRSKEHCVGHCDKTGQLGKSGGKGSEKYQKKMARYKFADKKERK